MRMYILFCCGLLLFFAAGASAADCRTATCWDYGPSNPLVSWLEVEWDVNGDYSGPDSTPYVSGDIIWVAASSHLVAYDGSDPRNVRLIHAEPIPSGASQVLVEGDFAYVTGWLGLTIVDVSDPGQPIIRATAGPREMYECVYRDGILYTAGYNGVVVFDVRDPSRPLAKASYTSRRGSDIDLRGDEIIAYDRGTLFSLAMNEDGTMTQNWHSQIGGRGFSRAGDFVFAADRNELRTYRLVPFGTPVLVGSRQLDRTGMVAVVGERLYAQDAVGIRVFELTSLPDLEESGVIGGYTWRMSPNQLGELVVMSTGWGILLIADPNVRTNQPSSGLLPLQRTFQGVAANGNLIYGSYANAYPDPRGIVAFDVSDPREPRVLGEITDVPRYPYDMQFRDHYLFTNGLVCLDVSDPANMRLVNPTRIGNYFAIQDSVAFVCGTANSGGYSNSVTSIDIRDPSQPRAIGYLPMGIRMDLIAHLEAAGSLLVVGAENNLALVDVADPTAMRLMWRMPMQNGYCRDLATRDDLVFYIGDASVMAIVDISDAMNPRVRSYFYPPVNTGYQTIAAGNDVVYLSSPVHGALVIDVSDPDRPRLTGAIRPLFFAGDYSLSLAVTSDQVAILSSDGFLQASPRQCGDVHPVQAVTIDVRPGNSCNRVPCGERARGLINVALLTTKDFDAATIDPSTLRFGPGGTGEIHFTPGAGRGDGDGGRSGRDHRGGGRHDDDRGRPRRHLQDVDCDGDFDFVAHFDADDAAFACGDTVAVLTGMTFAGIAICASDAVTTARHCRGHDSGSDEGDLAAKSLRETINCDGDKSDQDGPKDATSLFSRLPILAPNPFNPATAVAFDLERGAHLSVDVYDLAGRRVASLADQEFAAGAHVVRWRGCDDQGHGMSSGTYFVRVTGEDELFALRAILLR